MKAETKREKFVINSINIIKQTIADSAIPERRASTEYLLNLCLIEEGALGKENVWKILAILSNLRFYAQDVLFHMHITLKLSALFIKHTLFEQAIIMRAYYRMGHLLMKQSLLVYAYHYLLKSVVLSKAMNVDMESLNLLSESFSLTTSKLDSDLSLQAQKFLNRREEVITYFKDIEAILKRLQAKMALKETEKKMYLISSKWTESLMMFKEEFFNLEEKAFIVNAFKIESIYSNYFREEGVKADRSYPGEIDNFSITSFEDQWIDPLKENAYENEILKKGLEEFRDYHCLSEKEWEVISTLFGATNEIVRYKSLFNTWEVYLEEMEILVLEQDLKMQPNLLKIRKIQFSSQTLMSQLIEKIKRCLNLKESKFNYHFYSVSNENKEILVNLLIAYMMNCPTYQIPLNLLQIQMNETVMATILRNKITHFFLILEIFNQNSIPFITTNISNCSKCSKKIDSFSCYQCLNCYYVTHPLLKFTD